MKSVSIRVEDDLAVREVQSQLDIQDTSAVLAQALIHCLYLLVEKEKDRFIIAIGKIAATAINQLDNLAAFNHRVWVRCKEAADAKAE